jgi:hypothetical protein
MIGLLADVEDLAARVGRELVEGTTEHARAVAAIADASALVCAETGQTWDTESAPQVPSPVVVVVLQAAERKWRNPAGNTTRTAGPLGEGFTQQAASGVYLTEDERRILFRFSTRKSGLVSVPVERADVVSDAWSRVPIQYSDGTSGQSFPYFTEPL